MRDQTKNMLIGLFVLIALFLSVSLVLFLKPKVGDGKKILNARFSSISKIKVGTQLLLSGKPVGEVIDITVIPFPREQPTDPLGRFYYYQLKMKYDSSVDIYSTDKISIVTSGLLGEKSISITPQAPPKGVIPRLVEQQPVYADSVEDFDRLFFVFNDISGRLRTTLININSWIEENGPILSKSLHSFDMTMQQVEHAMIDFNELNILQDVKGVIADISRVAVQVDSALQTMHQENFFDNLNIVMDDVKNTSSSVRKIVDTIAQGKGTIGKLVESDDAYLRLMGVMSKTDTLMNDVNHYGLLFHLNKGWQRMRQKRMEAVNSLQTPADLKSYVADEVDNINTAMSRLSMAIDQVDKNQIKGCAGNTEPFKQEFAELLKQVNALFDSLRIYNESIQGCLEGNNE